MTTTTAPPRPLRARRALLILVLLCAVSLGLGIWAFWIEPSRLIIHRAEANWPGPLLRIALLSDLHIGAPHIGLEKLRQVVTMVDAESPDIVMIAGDFVTRGVLGGHLVEPELIAAELKNLRAPLGVVTVLGNHDWWYDGDRVTRALHDAGIAVLDNDALRVENGAASFWIAGLADAWTRQVNWQKALSKVNDEAPVLVLSHNTDVFPETPPQVDFVLAGHTHGGQVRFPLIGTPIVPSRYGQRYARGFILENNRKMFVTTGIGTSILPVRFGVPPEIVILSLVSQRESQP